MHNITSWTHFIYRRHHYCMHLISFYRLAHFNFDAVIAGGEGMEWLLPRSKTGGDQKKYDLEPRPPPKDSVLEKLTPTVPFFFLLCVLSFLFTRFLNYLRCSLRHIPSTCARPLIISRLLLALGPPAQKPWGRKWWWPSYVSLIEETRPRQKVRVV